MRFAGALVFLGSALAWGWRMSAREKERVRVMEGLLKFISYTEDEITSFRTPVKKIYEGFCCEALEKWGFVERLRREGAVSAVAELKEKGILTKDAESAVRSFAHGLGGGYSEGQRALCQSTKKRLETCLFEMRTALPGRVRMYRLLPLLLAVSLVIILI